MPNYTTRSSEETDQSGKSWRVHTRLLRIQLLLGLQSREFCGLASFVVGIPLHSVACLRRQQQRPASDAIAVQNAARRGDKTSPKTDMDAQRARMSLMRARGAPACCAIIDTSAQTSCALSARSVDFRIRLHRLLRTLRQRHVQQDDTVQVKARP